MRKRLKLSAPSTRVPIPTLGFDSHINHNLRNLLVNQLPAIVWTTDEELKITSCGRLSFVPYDRGPEEFIGMALDDFLGAGNTAAHYIADHRQLLEGVPLEFEAHHDGRAFTVKVGPLLDEESLVIGTVGVALQVTGRQTTDESMKYLATHDPLTDLANYRALLSAFDTELQRSDRTGRPFTALLLDVDGLKLINDRHGHLVGSKVLCRLANVLKRSCRSIDTIARYGGDEFAILLVETDESDAHCVAQRIKDGLAKDTEDPPITASVGIAVYPRDGYTVENLVAGADRMLYRNKMRLALRRQPDFFETRTNEAVGHPEMQRRRSERMALDVSVLVRGEATDSPPFQEETFTTSVSAHGALVMLASKVTPGQILVVKNLLTDGEKPARVVRFGAPYGGIDRVGLEFLEPAPEFWFVDVSSSRLASYNDKADSQE